MSQARRRRSPQVQCHVVHKGYTVPYIHNAHSTQVSLLYSFWTSNPSEARSALSGLETRVDGLSMTSCARECEYPDECSKKRSICCKPSRAQRIMGFFKFCAEINRRQHCTGTVSLQRVINFGTTQSLLVSHIARSASGCYLNYFFRF